MKKTILLLLVVVATLPAALAQKFSFDMDSRPTDFSSLAKRKLAVELLEEDGRAIAKLTKWKSDYPKGVENYRSYIKSYNEYIQKAVTDYWTLNKEIEFKTTKEIKKLVDGRDKDYAILRAKELGGGEEYITRFNGTAISLVLFKPEKSDKVDYVTILPYAFSRNDQSNTLTDFIFTIQSAAANITYMIEKKTTSTFPDFIETQAIANCKLLKDKQLLIEPNLLAEGIDKKGIKEYYKKKFDIIKQGDLVQAAVEGKDESKCHVVLIPFSTYQNPFDRNLTTYLLCYKLIVNSADGKILNYMEGKAKSGSDMSLVQEKDFKALDSCEK